MSFNSQSVLSSHAGISLFACIIICDLLVTTPADAQWSFKSLGDFTNGPFQSEAYDVSDDGKSVVGGGNNADNNKAFYWTLLGGMAQIENSALYSHSSAISADGSVAVGWIWNQATNRVDAYRWTESDGAVPIGDLSGGNFESYANDVSADGSVIVGQGHSNLGYEATRWTAATGQVSLGDLDGGSYHSCAFGISRDGTTIVGRANSTQGQEAFRWTSADHMVGLGDLDGGIFDSHAEDVLANGDIVVGYGHSALGKEAIRWTQATGMVGLGDLPGGAHDSWAWGGSVDGAIIVGQGTTDLGKESFIWDAVNGMRNLRTVAESHNAIIPTGWQLTHALAMSADGRFIVGVGDNPSGNREAWIIQVPEPESLLFSLLGVVGIVILYHRSEVR